jgi:hypothetical protein
MFLACIRSLLPPRLRSKPLRRSATRTPGGLGSSLLATAAFGVACSSVGGPSTEAPAEANPADAAETADAISTLGRMSEFLASRPMFRFESNIRYDTIQPSGQKIEFGSHRKLAFVAPNRARVDVQHWDGPSELMTFDGSRLSSALPDARVYATVEFEGTVREATDYLGAEHSISSPLLELVRRDLADELADRVVSARDLGTVILDGTPCDHLAFRGEHLDFQIFIQQGAEPLPRRLVIDYHGAEGSPQFRAQMSQWSLSSELPDKVFRFIPPPGSQRVPFETLLDLLLGPEEDRR